MPISAQTVDSDVTATWPFDLGTEGQTATITPEDGGEWFKNSYVEIGSGLIIPEGKETEAVDGLTLTKLRPTVKATTPDDNATVKFMISPKNGLKFKPTEISFRAARFGTDDCLIDISWIKADGSVTKLQTGIKPGRPKNSKGEPEYTDVLINDLAAIEAPEGLCGLQIHIYSLGNTKEAGFANVIIKGHIEGTPVEIKQCTLTVQTSPEGAGTISVQPVGSVFDENTELTLTQTRNFGYKFTGWSVGGETVSTDDTYTFNITEDATVTANYDKINTYSLTYGATGGGKDYMITPTPAPTVVDGKNMYEEGQEVTLTATGNYILDFANWSSGETTPELKVTMDADKNATAAFSSKLDCIAGWDFYTAGNESRKADFYAADNDADVLIMRNETGEQSSWLDKSIADEGGQEGRGAAVNWKENAIGDYYWQTQINAEAFKDITVHSAMFYNFNAYPKQDVEYSLNGTTWTKAGTFNLDKQKTWFEQDIKLPEEANNQKTVYIRWKSDKTSAITGSESVKDGISIADIYITGTQEYVNDGVAPKLESTVPAEGATNASANGRIVLNFDEKVKVKEGATATLGDLELEPQVSGKTVMFEYKGLSYSTRYTFTLPANTVSDLTDNFITDDITVNFTTMTRPVVTKALYDFIVPNNGTITEAIAAAANREDTSKRFYIFVKQGDYVIPASETEPVPGSDGKQYPDPRTIVSTPNVSIIGEGMDNTSFANTVPDNIKNEKGEDVNPLEGLDYSATFEFTKDVTGMYVQDITFRNSMDDGTGRNCALDDGGNKNVFKNVRLYGYQDTYLSDNQNGRFYFEGGELRGRTDFLCGKGDVYYNGVTLVMCEAGGYLAVPSLPKEYGYIFKDCTIKGETNGVDGNYTLGRPWGEGTPIALYIDTKMEVQPTAAGWSEMGTGWPARFAEYNSTTASGTTIDLSNRKKTFAGTHDNNPVLTKEEADSYTIEKVMGGDDDWNPASLTEQASAPTNVEIDGSTLTWDDSQYVLCWAVCRDGKVIDFTTEPTYTVGDASAKYSVRAANQMGGLGEAAEAQIATGIDEVGAAENGEAVSTAYYSIDGTRVNNEYRGVVIEVKTMADGSKTVRKTIRK